MVEFHVQLMLVLLAYGLAFFAMGLAIVLQWRSDSNLPFTRSLPALANFAFLQGLFEWTNILFLFSPNDLTPAGSNWGLETARVVLLGTSHLFLFWFGVDLVVRSEAKWGRARWLAPVLFLLWAVGTLTAVQRDQLPAADWTSVAETLADCLLSLPGGFLAVWGMHKQKRVFDGLRMPRVGMDCIWAGAILTFYTLLEGLQTFTSVLPAIDLPNAARFASTTGLSIESLQALLAIGIAFFVLRIVRAYQQELRHQVEDADRARCQAQEEALGVHRRAEEQLRLWNETLERKVLDRTHELTRRQREAEALYRIAAKVVASMDLDTILHSVADHSCELLRADLATVTLLEEGCNPVRVASGARTEAFSSFCSEPGVGIVGRVLATRLAAKTDDYLDDEGFRHRPEVDALVAEEGLRAHLAAPVMAGERLLGVLRVASRGDRRFDEEDQWLLARLTMVTAVALQNSSLYAKAQQVAVLEERERIAREIHDGLAQTLGCLGMMASAAQTRLDGGQVERVQSALEEMEKMAHEAYADAREAILGLRVSSYGGPRLARALREYLRRFGEQCGIDAQLQVSPSWPDTLSGNVEIQVMRIVQEALSNVRKHAAASQVIVDLSVSSRWTEICVQDDGKGFDVDNSRDSSPGDAQEDRQGGSGCHFGMQTMRERAGSIGAELVVRSAPGRGTRVLIRLPREDSHRDNRRTALGTVA